MAKFANKNQEQVIPTAEQNQAELLALQKNSQRLIDLQTEEYINQKKAEQFGNFGLLNADVGQALSDQKYAPLETKGLNQDIRNQPESWVRYSVSTILMEILLFILQWCVWLRNGQCVILW